jgi:hypothetical protein
MSVGTSRKGEANARHAGSEEPTPAAVAGTTAEFVDAPSPRDSDLTCRIPEATEVLQETNGCGHERHAGASLT